MSLRTSEIEGDGLLDSFFEILWSKIGTESCSLRIPESVIFKYRQPYAWFFTSTDGSIKRKSRVNLTTVKILEIFLKRKNAGGIVASFHRSLNGSVVS
jgi:hypothetical protein